MLKKRVWMAALLLAAALLLQQEAPGIVPVGAAPLLAGCSTVNSENGSNPGACPPGAYSQICVSSDYVGATVTVGLNWQQGSVWLLTPGYSVLAGDGYTMTASQPGGYSVYSWQCGSRTATFNVSYQPPTTSLNLSGGAPGANGWYIVSPLTLSLSVSQGQAPVANTYLNGAVYAGPLTLDTDGTTTYTYYSVDTQGNTESSQSSTVKIDTVAPTTTLSLAGTSGLNGWYVSPMTVTLTGADATSGIASTTLNGNTYTAPVTFNDGTNTLTYRSTDQAGNAETEQTQTIKVDTVAPATTYSLSGTLGNNNWYTTPVTVTLSGSDATSGIASTTIDGAAYTAPVTYSSEGATTFTFRSADNAGNAETDQSVSIKIDTVPRPRRTAWPARLAITAGMSRR